MRQLLARNREEFKARNRAFSESTAVPIAGDTLTETFDTEMEVSGLRFTTVKLFHPRNGTFVFFPLFPNLLIDSMRRGSGNCVPRRTSMR